MGRSHLFTQPWHEHVSSVLSLFLLLAIIPLFIPFSLSLVLTIGTALHSDSSSSQPGACHFIAVVDSFAWRFGVIRHNECFVSTGCAWYHHPRFSGFGAVSNAWAFFPLFSCNRTVTTEGDLSTAEQSL
ncbi:hypothetical protein PILCRDRAFT_757986 [Piloderma croceum F 1598]|uniref:Golgi pH regulator conserved domain-containing protein n=1 Tax=Piloderma croceum (strain F 1598) TaxID=765440 RepID=A0A0C3ETY8_PILCF|nr:hypothetical protein PILCRDRAFT_757986 [Piloderma croceum F 1598]